MTVFVVSASTATAPINIPTMATGRMSNPPPPPPCSYTITFAHSTVMILTYGFGLGQTMYVPDDDAANV